MKTMIVGALVCAAVAGVVFYLYNQDEVNSQLGDLKDKASGALDKAKNNFSQKADEVESWAQS